MTDFEVECISALNKIKELRELSDRPLSKNEIKQMCGNVGLPKSPTFVKLFEEAFFKEVEKGKFQYRVPKKTPIYIGILNNLLNTYNKKMEKIIESRTNSRKENKEKASEEPICQALVKVEHNDELNEENAIEFLKERNYVILKPKAIVYNLI